MSPVESEDLTEVVRPRDGAFVVLHSPDTAEHQPAYCAVATFPTRREAEAYMSRVS